MAQYLLNIYQPDGDPPPPEILEPIMRQLDALNADLKAAGAWVFAGGLHPPSTATVLRAKDSEVLMTDGPYLESKEHIGGFTIITAPDLDAAHGLGLPARTDRPPARGGGAPLPRREWRLMP